MHTLHIPHGKYAVGRPCGSLLQCIVFLDCPSYPLPCPHYFRFFWQFMHTFWGCLCSFLCIYVYLLSAALNNNTLTAFGGAHMLPGKGDVLASAVGTRPPKCIQIFMHASLFICNIFHMADMQRGGPVVPYCKPQLAAVEAALPPYSPQARSGTNHWYGGNR